MDLSRKICEEINKRIKASEDKAKADTASVNNKAEEVKNGSEANQSTGK